MITRLASFPGFTLVPGLSMRVKPGNEAVGLSMRVKPGNEASHGNLWRNELHVLVQNELSINVNVAGAELNIGGCGSALLACQKRTFSAGKIERHFQSYVRTNAIHTGISGDLNAWVT